VPELNKLYQEFADQLEKENKYNDAAIILSKYMNKLEDAVAMLCKGKKWVEAWNEACYINRLDLIGNVVIVLFNNSRDSVIFCFE
jgi:hypothetical protein